MGKSEVKKDNMKHNAKDNARDNTKHNARDNTKHNAKDNTKHNAKDNAKHTKHNTKHNARDNTKHNARDNTKHNARDNTRDNTKHNARDNTKDNAIENVQKELIRKQLNELISKDLDQEYKRLIVEPKTSNVTGDSSSETIGVKTRETRNNTSGDSSNNTSGDSSGNASGDSSGNASGSKTSNVTGNSSGNTTGDSSGNTTGDSSGNMSGLSTDEYFMSNTTLFGNLGDDCIEIHKGAYNFVGEKCNCDIYEDYDEHLGDRNYKISSVELYRDTLRSNYNDMDDIISRVSYHYYSPKLNDDKVKTLKDLLQGLVTFYENAEFKSYDNVSRIKYSSDLKLINEITIPIVKMSRRDFIKFRRVRENFSEIKDKLVLDKSGMYGIKILNSKNEEVIYPILCTHEYMILNGESYAEMSGACYDKGRCKFCGCELYAYHDSANIIIDSKLYSHLTIFVEGLKGSYNETNLVYNLMNEFTRWFKMNKYDENDMSKMFYIYMYYLVVTLLKDYKKYLKRTMSSFILKLRKSLALWRLTDRNIPHVDIRVRNILSIIDHNNLNAENMLSATYPFNVMLGTDYKYVIGIKDYKPKDNFEKMFIDYYFHLSDDFGEFLNEYWEEILRKYIYPKTEEYIRRIKKVKVDDQFEKMYQINKKEISNNRIKFFEEMASNYCPKKLFHEFKNNVCQYCGLKKDLSNLYEIYEIFHGVIEDHIIHLVDIDEDDLDKYDIKNKYKLNDLDKIDGKLENMINDNFFKQSYNEIIKHPEIVDKIIYPYLRIHTNEPKALVYIVKNDIASTAEIKQQIIYYYIMMNKDKERIGE